MSRDPRLYLEEILDCITKVMAWTEDQTFESFESDELLRSAVLHKLENMGEAISRLPQEIKAANPTIDWRGIGDFRNRLAHGYFDVNNRIVWNLIRNRLPALGVDVSPILAKLDGDPLAPQEPS